MFSIEKRLSPVLQVLALMLGITIVPNAAAWGASHAPVLIHAEMALAANPGIDSACQPALDAGDKLFTTPYHAFATMSMPGAPHPMNSESVFVGGALYVLMNGKWSSSGMSVEEMKAMEQRNRTNAHNMSCHYLRDELVKGEPAALYTTHEETPHGKTDSKTWISKSRGLILRQEIDIDTGGPNGKTHMTSRYEYENVQVPKN